MRPEQTEQNADTQSPPEPHNEQISYGSKLQINPITPSPSNEPINTSVSSTNNTPFPIQPATEVDVSSVSYALDSEREETFAAPSVATSSSIYPALPTNQTPTMPTPKKKKHYVRNTLLTLTVLFIGLVVIATIGYYARGTVRVSDLVQSEVKDTTYLHPEKWEKISTPTGEGYGDGLGKGGKSSAVIIVNRSDRTRLTSIANADPATVSMTRDTWMKAAERKQIDMPTQNNEFGCKQLKNTTTALDTHEDATTIGLFTSTSDCDVNGTPFKLKMKFMLGRDGYLRTVGMMASEKSWIKNAEAFNKMYDSVKQSP